MTLKINEWFGLLAQMKYLFCYTSFTRVKWLCVTCHFYDEYGLVMKPPEILKWFYPDVVLQWIAYFRNVSGLTMDDLAKDSLWPTEEWKSVLNFDYNPNLNSPIWFSYKPWLLKFQTMNLVYITSLPFLHHLSTTTQNLQIWLIEIGARCWIWPSLEYRFGKKAFVVSWSPIAHSLFLFCQTRRNCCWINHEEPIHESKMNIYI